MVLHVELDDIFFALARCLRIGAHASLTSAEACARVERLWFPQAPELAFASLSVRTTLMLLFEALALPAGSEVLVTALTILDVIRVIEHFNLVAVPVDVNLDTLAPETDQFARLLAASPRARVAVLTHVFGSRYDISALACMARARGLLVVEDCAQAFVDRSEYRGSAHADVACFSFGTIKRSTAFGGSLSTLSGLTPELRARMRQLRDQLPARAPSAYPLKLVKGALLRFALAQPQVARLFTATLHLLGLDTDDVVSSLVRGFPGAELIGQLSHAAEPALTLLLERRLAKRSLAARTASEHRALCAWVRAHLPANVYVPGGLAPVHSYWLFPVVPYDARALIAALRAAGFDATQGASQMKAVPVPPAWLAAGEPRVALARASAAEFLLARLVYLPVTLAVPSCEVQRMVAVVARATRHMPHPLTGALSSQL